jgi:hypothetical protein
MWFEAVLTAKSLGQQNGESQKPPAHGAMATEVQELSEKDE